LRLPVRFRLPDGGQVRESTVTVSRADEDFYFPLPAQPDLVRLDPEFTLLAKVAFTPPPEMLKKQVESDLIGRLLAIEALSEKKDDESVTSLGKLAAEDAFWGLRIEAVKALRKMNTPASRRTLVALPGQPDARVRREVVSALAAAYDDGARDALLSFCRDEKNPDVLAAIIGALTTWPDWDAAEFLHRPSYRQRVAAAAIAAIRARDDHARGPDVLARLRDSAMDFETDDYRSGLDALAFVSRRQENKDGVRTFLAGHLTHPREAYRQAAARALGTLGDPRGVALLRPLTAERKRFKDPVREAAEKSIQQIESLQTGPPELQKVWQRLQELQKKTEEMESHLEKLKKKAAPEKP